MTREEVEKKTHEIIANLLAVDPEKVVTTARLSEDLGADSLDLIEVVMELEGELHIEIADEDAEKLKTVGDVVAYVTKKVGAE